MSRKGKTREIVYYLSKTKDNKHTYETFKRAKYTDNKFSLEEAKSLISEARKLMRDNDKALFNIAKRFNEHHMRKYIDSWNIFLLKENKIEDMLKKVA